jgi:hypothetical protein
VFHRLSRVWIVLIGLLGALSCQGCGAFATRYPIYDPEKEAILDTRLLGTWYSEHSVLRFLKWHGGLWMQDVTPDSCRPDALPAAPAAVDAVKLGEHEFIFVAVSPFDIFSKQIGTWLIGSYRVEIEDHQTTLMLGPLDTLALAKSIQDHPGTIAYEETGNVRLSLTTQPATQPIASQPSTQPTTQPEIKNMILTDDPKRIRQLLIDHANDPAIFQSWVVYKRVSESK